MMSCALTSSLASGLLLAVVCRSCSPFVHHQFNSLMGRLVNQFDAPVSLLHLFFCLEAYLFVDLRVSHYFVGAFHS